MVKKKAKSKRITLKDKYKIQRKVAEKHRKDKKIAKRNAKLGVVDHRKQFLKKDPGIPNSWPFKKDLLKEVEHQKQVEEERRANMNSQKKKVDLESLMKSSISKQQEFETKQQQMQESSADQSSSSSLGQNSRRAYLRELKKVIESSDVLLQVLDCRDPLSTRLSKSVEDAIISHFDKKMVLVLNKVDLVPKEVVKRWLTYLRRSFPTIAVRAGISNSANNIGRSKGDAALQHSTNAIGMEGLLQLLKNYARISPSDSTKTCITVGVVGYPNVGKSSILNSLKRVRAVGVSPRPGFTTTIQEVVLDKNIRLLDSPGVVAFDEYNNKNSDASILLRNCIDIDRMEDAIPAVQSLLQRCDIESLIMTYNIPMFPEGDYNTFLSMIAKKYGKVLRGGIPDKMNAARTVLRHWNTGKIPFFTVPPEEQLQRPKDAKIVDKFDPELDIQLFKTLDSQQNQEEAHDVLDYVQFQSRNSTTTTDKQQKLAKMLVNEGNNDEMEEESQREDNDDSSMEEDDEEEEHLQKNSRMANAEDFDFANL